MKLDSTGLHKNEKTLVDWIGFYVELSVRLYVLGLSSVSPRCCGASSSARVGRATSLTTTSAIDLSRRMISGPGQTKRAAKITRKRTTRNGWAKGPTKR